MKVWTLLTWMTQLGLSIAAPLVGFIFLALWLRNQFSLGGWILWVGILLGLISALDGLRTSLKALTRLTKSEPQDKPAVSFHDHA